MKDIETPDKMHLQRLINNLSNGNYTIPDFQREFVWKPWDVVELIKSIFEDYYIGTLLFWRASRENQKVLSCEPIYGYDGDSGAQHIVLDGQQRLSSLYYAFFSPDVHFPRRKNKCYFFVNIVDFMNEDYEDAFYYEWDYKRIQKLLENEKEQFERGIFPLKVIGKGYAWLKWIRNYQDYWREKGKDKKVKQGKVFEQFLEEMINNYYISYIELDREIEISKVCDIFTRVNNTGVDLSIFDLLNAMLRPKKIFLKDMWRDVKDDFEITREDRMRIYMLQAMSIIKQGYCSAKYLYYLVPEAVKKVKDDGGELKEKVLIDTSQGFIDLWNFVVDETRETIKELTNPRDFGVIKPKYLPYSTMLPILTVLHAEQKKEDYQDKSDVKKKIKEWYWASIFTQNYSSSVESQMAKDYSELKRWFKDDKKLPKVIVRFSNEINNLDLISETNKNSAIYKAIFTILIQKGAKDWATFDLPEYSALEDHHIVPRSWGQKQGIPLIDSILNKVPLSAETNKNVIRDKLPNEYLKEMFDKSQDEETIYELLTTHLISRRAVKILLRKPFTPEDYREFIKERQKTVMKEIKKLVRLSQPNPTGFISPAKPYSNRMQMEQTIKSCANYIHWLDKYFSKKGFDYLLSVFSSTDKPSVNEIKILTSLDKIDKKNRKYFKEFKEEMNNLGIKVEMKVIVDNEIKSKIHDRWIITDGKNYNIPSTDTIARGQYSEIKETKGEVPFDEWWDESLDVIDQWPKIERKKEK